MPSRPDTSSTPPYGIVRRSRLATGLLLIPLLSTAARATLDTPEFRAVGVARARHPISAVAVAPDGRMFAAIQATAQTSDREPGTAEIWVYAAYSALDGAYLDDGTLWATLPEVRATNAEEGLLGLALAPDFATSKLVYAYVTTTKPEANRELRVYRENGTGTGDFLGVAKTWGIPPDDRGSRYAGALTFGPDGCLYAGIGDNQYGWNAQVADGTDPPPTYQEYESLCENVCKGPAEIPPRTIYTDRVPNDHGKVVRFKVEGASPVAPAPGGGIPALPQLFAAGLMNPSALGTHPLTGQLFVGERGERRATEINVADSGSNFGWPCLEGNGTAMYNGCADGSYTADEVRAQHPAWRRPLVTHEEDYPPWPTGVAAYTGLAYPQEYYGDMFYVLWDYYPQIYRVDLQPPCFLPPVSGGLAPLSFHTSQDYNDDFVVYYDTDGDYDLDYVAARQLSAITQGPSPFGQVLYVAGRQNSSFEDDAIVYRIDYATLFTPYGGPQGRVDDACFGSGTPDGYENPFARAQCLPPGGPCPGQPDGTACDDGDPCNGSETCTGGICRGGATAAADGTPCNAGSACTTGSCQAGRCANNVPVADGTPCPDTDPCNGLELCSGGACQPGGGPGVLGSSRLAVKGGSTLSLRAAIRPSIAMSPSTSDAVIIQFDGPAGAMFSQTLGHPDTDARWKRSRPPRLFFYDDAKTSSPGVMAVSLRSDARMKTFQLGLKARGVSTAALSAGQVVSRVIVGDQCFTAMHTCSAKGRSLRCK